MLEPILRDNRDRHFADWAVDVQLLIVLADFDVDALEAVESISSATVSAVVLSDELQPGPAAQARSSLRSTSLLLKSEDMPDLATDESLRATVHNRTYDVVSSTQNIFNHTCLLRLAAR